MKIVQFTGTRNVKPEVLMSVHMRRTVEPLCQAGAKCELGWMQYGNEIHPRPVLVFKDDKYFTLFQLLYKDWWEEVKVYNQESGGVQWYAWEK